MGVTGTEQLRNNARKKHRPFQIDNLLADRQGNGSRLSDGITDDPSDGSASGASVGSADGLAEGATLRSDLRERKLSRLEAVTVHNRAADGLVDGPGAVVQMMEKAPFRWAN